MKKPQPKAKLFEEVPDYLLEKGGVGLSHRLSDTAYWLEDIPDFYIELLDKLDRTKDPKLLLPLLRVPKAVLPHFADLFDRHTLKRHSRRTPSYQRTDLQVCLMLALGQIKQRPKAVTLMEAIEKAAQDFQVSRAALANAYYGKHTSLRRVKRR
jgi:hypothetical protein